MTPEKFIQHENLDEFCGNQIEPEKDPDDYSVTSGGPPYRIGSERLEYDRKEYQKIRDHLIRHLKESKITIEQFLATAPESHGETIPTKVSSRRPKGRG